MNERLDYRRLLRGWMTYYTLSPERAQALYAAVKARIRRQEEKDREEKTDGKQMENTD